MAMREGAVEVKTRGGLGVDTDRLQKAWSKATGRAWTVLVFRHERGSVAVVAGRV
jgi:hypothetical protein